MLVATQLLVISITPVCKVYRLFKLILLLFSLYIRIILKFEVLVLIHPNEDAF